MAKGSGRHFETRALPVTLTDDELEAKGRELARVTMEEQKKAEAIATLKSEQKLALAKAEEDRINCAGTRMRLAREVTTRTVWRDVVCDWVFDVERGRAILVRRDLKAAVDVRPITAEERQLKLGEEMEAANVDQLAIWEDQLRQANVADPPPAEAPPAPAEPAPDEDDGDDDQDAEGLEEDGDGDDEPGGEGG